MNPIQRPDLQEFQPCPGNPDILVSREGEVYISKEDRFIRTSHYQNGNKDTYYSFCRDGVEYAIHKLVLDVFLTVPGELKGLRVIGNHKNGNKRDNRLSNLEWTTYSGNIIHAYESGLRKDITPVLCKRHENGEVERFKSIQHCARSFNVNPGKVYDYLKSLRKRFWEKHYILIKEGQDWPEMSWEDRDRYERGGTREILLHQTTQNKYYIFSSITKMAECIGTKNGTVAKRLRSLESNVGDVWFNDGEWRYCYLSRFREEIPEDVERVKDKPNTGQFSKGQKSIRTSPRVKVTDLSNDSVKEYGSLQNFADEQRVSHSSVQAYLYRHGPVWKNQYKVEALT